MPSKTPKSRSKASRLNKDTEILESISDGFFALDSGWCFTYINKQAASNLGFKTEDLIGQNLWEKFPQFMGAELELKCRKAMTKKQPQELEVQGPVTRQWHNVRVYPSEEGISVYWQDITLRKQSENEIKLQSLMLNAVGDSIVATDANGYIIYWNESATKTYGWKESEVLGCDIREIIVPKESKNESDLIMNKLIKGEHCSGEFMFNRKDGTVFLAEVTQRPVVNQHGKLIGTIGVSRDCTSRKQAEEALSKAKDELEIKVKKRTAELVESEEKYRRIFETANEGIWIVDLQGKILMANNRVSETLGYPLEEIIGRGTRDFLIKDRERPILAKMIKALDKGGKLNYERRLRHKNGSTIYLLVNSSPLLDSEGRHIANIGMMANITRRKKAEEALTEAKAELEKANRQLKAYGQRITQVQEEERKKIAYELHDDTAQYLAILKLQLDSLINSGKIQDQTILEKLGYLEKDAGRAVDDIRRYSHELRPGVLDHLGLQAALEQIAEDHNKVGQIRVEVNVEGREPELSEDIKLGFFRVAQEAINNCRKHAKASMAYVNLMFTDNSIQLTVSDKGVGFDVQQAASRTREKGSLGLMSMQERATLIEANLKIESQPGQGTSVTLEMPL
jgi:PAS domain S-box-containing protein